MGTPPARRPSTLLLPLQLWRRAPIAVRDGVGGLILFVLAILPLDLPGVALGELDHVVTGEVSVVLAAAQTLGLALRRVRPAIGLVVVGCGFAAGQLAGVDASIAGLGLFLAIYSVAAYQRSHQILIDVATVVGYIVLAVALHLEGSPERTLDWVTFLLVLSVPWFVGQLVRRRIAAQTGREQEAADRAVREAKNQLARDLHDIVTHHVTAMVVQADSAAYLDADDVAERAQTLDAIGATGRRALSELRSLLGALEHSPPKSVDGSGAPTTPVPTSGDVASLVRENRATGYPVTLVESGPAVQLSESVAITLYRVAQEALTNAMKHAPGTPVEMVIATSATRVELTVTNRFDEQLAALSGRGRRGMAERVRLLHGTFEAGVIDGRFRVHASLDAGAQP
jgi:signal transduction histidine kinase